MCDRGREELQGRGVETYLFGNWVSLGDGGCCV